MNKLKPHVVAYQDENNDPHFLVEHLDRSTWTSNPMLCEQFDTFQLAWDAMKYVETTVTGKPRFGMVVMTYDSIKRHTFHHWLDPLLDKAAVE